MITKVPRIGAILLTIICGAPLAAGCGSSDNSSSSATGTSSAGARARP